MSSNEVHAPPVHPVLEAPRARGPREAAAVERSVRPMRILLVAHGFPRRENDMAGAFLLALARGQQALGHEVTAVAPHAPGCALDDVVGGVRVRRYRYGSDDQETLAYRGTMHDQVLRSWPARIRLLALLRAARRAVAGAARDFAPDVVHVHWWFPGGLAVWPSLVRQPPCVLTSHGTDLFLLDRFRVARFLAAPVFRAASQVTVISQPLVDRVVALGVPRSRITVVPMPLDDAAAPPPHRGSGAARLLFVGRLVERKGAEFALRALAVLRASGREATLAIVGDGPERPLLEALARELAVADATSFAGMLPPDEVATFYARSDVVLLPAVTDWKGEQEGFGMVLVEAMRAGLPVVASRSGGIADIVSDEETGLLVPERDTPALAAALTRLIDSPALARRLGDAGQVAVRARFEPGAIARVFDDVYRKAVSGSA